MGSADLFVETDSERTLLETTGEDRATFLQGMLSNEVVSLEAGQGAPALLLTDQGRIVATLDFYVCDEAILLDLTESAGDRLLPALERFIVADDVEFAERNGIVVALRGSSAPELLGELLAVEEELAAYAHRQVMFGEAELLVARVDDIGSIGFRIWCPSLEVARVLTEACQRAGAASLSHEAREVRRVSAGIAREDVDFDVSTLAPEVPSLSSSVSSRKGCYLGQEVVERVASRGKVNWIVTPVMLTAPAAVGARLRLGEREVGRLTSVALPDADGSVPAIGRLRREIAEQGGKLDIVSDNGDVCGSAAVVAPSL